MPYNALAVNRHPSCPPRYDENLAIHRLPMNGEEAGENDLKVASAELGRPLRSLDREAQ